MKKFRRKVLDMLMSNNSGSSLRQQLFDSAPFCSELLYTAIPQRAASGTTGIFTRATTKTWKNNDGYMVTGVAGEIGFPGARREYNQISNGGSYKSEGAFNSWTKGGVPPTVTDGIAGPDGRLTAARVVFAGSGAGNAIYTVGANGTGRTGIVSAQIRGDAAGTIRLLASNSGAFIDAAVTTEWQRFTIPAFAMTNTDGVAFLRNDVGQLETIYVADAMIKDVTAQTTQTAGEYVSVGVVQRNKLLWTEDLTNAVWTKVNGGTGTAPVVTAGQTDPNGGATAFRVQANSGASATGADYSVVRQSLGTALSNTAKRSIYIKSNTGSSQTIYFGSPANNNSITATTSWQRLDVTSGVSSVIYDIGVYPGGGSGLGGATCDVLVWHPQAEENASVTEYQAVGGSYIYHGSFVDGVKCFPTDLAGNALPTSYTYDAVSLNGVAGTYVSTPDSVALDITIPDVRVKAQLADWSPSGVNYALIARRNGTDGDYVFRVLTSGALGLYWYTSGGVFTSVSSSAAVSASANETLWVRFTRSGTAVNFFQSPDGVTWTSVGTEQTAASASTSGSSLAMYIGQTQDGADPLAGTIYRAQIYNGINGTLAVDFDASRYAGGTTLTGSTGETWTLNGNAVIHPTNSPMLGYLAQGARTNLCLQSQTIATAPWQIGNGIAVTADQYVAPDGTTTMDKLTAIAGNTQHFWYQELTTTAAVHTYSVYLRYVNNQWARIGVYDGVGSFYAAFDILNGVVGSTLGAVTATAIEPMGDGVTWRVSLTATLAANALSQVYLSVVNADDPSFGLWNAVGTEAIGAWGAQVELGSSASSYIATTTIAVARNADVLTYSGGDIPNLKTLCATFRRESGVASTGVVLELDDGGGLAYNAMYLTSATNLRFEGRTTGGGGAIQWQVNASNAYTPGASSKSAVSAATNDIKMAFSGVAQTADTSATLSPFTQLSVGYSGGTGGLQLSGNVGGIYGWTRNLSQSEENAITA